jgi:hypothetical protein
MYVSYHLKQAMDDFINELSKSAVESDAGAALHMLDFIAAVFLQRKTIGAKVHESLPSTQMTERIRQGVRTFLNQLSRLNEHILHLLSSDTDLVDLLVSVWSKYTSDDPESVHSECITLGSRP